MVNGLAACHPLNDIATDAFGLYLAVDADQWVDEDTAAAILAGAAFSEAGTDKEQRKVLAEYRGQIRVAVRDGLLPGEDLGDTYRFRLAAVMGLHSQVRVLDVVADFGTWLTHVNGGANAETVNGIERERLPLFQAPPLAESAIRPALVRKGKKWIPFEDLSVADQARALQLSEMQQLALTELAEASGDEAAKAKIEEIIVSRERMSQARRVGMSPAEQAEAAKARKATASDEDEQLPLFGEAAKPRRRRSRSAGSVRTSARREALIEELRRDANAVVIPPGFERKAWHKRDVAKALASIVVTDPDDETIARFIARKYQTQAKVLTFPHVTQVWMFARLGRLERFDRINPKNPVFGQLAVEAFDLLEVARQDAINGLLLLAAGPGDRTELANACTKASWLAESEIKKIAGMIERGSPDVRLAVELNFLRQRIESNPSGYMPASIAELNPGQVRRIAMASGLSVDNDDRSEEAEIRQALKDYGFTNDLDRLVPAGVKASRAGRREEFFDVMKARKAGDNEWHLAFEDLFESLNA